MKIVVESVLIYGTIIENYLGQKFTAGFIDLLLEMKDVKEKAIEAGKESLSYYYHHKFDQHYEALLKQAREENPLPVTTEKKCGRMKKGKILSLVERLVKYKASVCLLSGISKCPLITISRSAISG